MEKVYDVIILGAGPAGLAAGIYAGRAELETLIIERAYDGGQIAITGEIVNYPGGLLENEDGASLTDRMVRQAKAFGVQRASDTITDVSLDGEIKILTGKKGEYHCKALIIASGASPKKLGAKGEQEHIGAGVSFCATCDGAFFRNKEVFVVGGGDSALEESLYLTRFAKRVRIVHRSGLRAAKSLISKAERNEKIEFISGATIEAIEGEGMIKSVVVKDSESGQTTAYADENGKNMGVFIFVGYKPQTELFENKLALEHGYIVTDENMHTSVDGVFAAGDVRKKTLRQVITAAADGAIAATSALKYLEHR